MFISAAALAFASGWAVNGWRLNAKQAKAFEQLTEELSQRLTDQATASRLANERLRLRETELLQELEGTRRSVVILTEEIDNAPVVTIENRVEVPANCPAVEQCATVDVVRFRALYNRAASPTVPDSSPSDSPVP